jgi:hypothetical protein
MMTIRWKVRAVVLLVLVAIASGDLAAQSTTVPTMTLLVDETQAFRRIASVHEQIQVHVAKENRKTQAKFECVECGHNNNADVVGAINILERGHRLFACRGDLEARGPKKQEPAEMVA